MDPVLSSTIEFDEYIKSNLSLAGKRFSSTSASIQTDRNRNGNSNAQPSAGTRGNRQDNRSRNTSDNLSQEFLQLNIRKYDQSTNGPPRQSRSAGASIRPPPAPITEEASPSPRIPLQHSWKAHLSSYSSSKSTSGTPDIGSAGRIRNTGTAIPAWRYPENDFSDDILEPKSSPTKPRSPLKIVPEYSSITKTNPASLEESKSYDDSEFSRYKVRLVTLNRMFATWATVCKDSRKILTMKCRDVRENSLYWPKFSCFTWWVLLYRAVTHAQVAGIRRAINTLWKGYKLSRRRRVLVRKAQYHYNFMRTVQYFSYFVRLGQKCRVRRQSQQMVVRAHNFRHLGLARRVLLAWKQLVGKIKADRLLDAEHNVRREKIALFMRRMQQPCSDGPVPSPIPTTTTSPSPSRTTSSTAATSTTTAMHSSATSRSQRQPSPAMAHRRSTAAAASSASSGRSHGSGLQSKHANQHENVQSRARSSDYRSNTNRTWDAADSKEQESISTQDSNMRDYKASDCRKDLQHEQNSDESSEQYSADEDFEEADVPPPSYDALMRQSHSSLQAKEPPPRATSIPQRQHQQRSTGEVLSRQTISSRRDKASPTTMQTASATSNNITLSDTAGMTFTERAAARRQRSLLLRKQAEERVQEKTQLKIATEREKQQKEAEEAEAIRKEARAQQVQAKIYTDRRRSEQADILRELLGRAKKFRAQQLVVRWGIAPWQQLMELARLNVMKAESYRSDRLLHAAWSALLGYIIALRTERYRREHRQSAVAVAHYRRKLLKFVWRTMRLYHKSLAAKSKALTGHFSRYTLRKRSFQAWRVAYERSVRLILRQLRSVQPRGDRSVKRHYFQQWLSYHAGALEDREIRQRVNSKWAAVQGWMSST